MTNHPIPSDFIQAKAILRDAYFKATATHNEKENIGLLKLLKAREENIDFEIELAERICGDKTNYPYRSSYYLTKFFQDLGFNFVHDGSTRRFWVGDMLFLLDIREIALCIQQGLFRKKDFSNPNFRTTATKDLSDEDFLISAIQDFKSFIDQSVKSNEIIDLDKIIDLNINVELLFDNKTLTKDGELNKLIDEAKERFLKPNDQHIALEKLWDAFERIKTYYDANKKASANKLLDQIAIEIEREIFEKEFELLTTIGNKYRIRHHETDKKPITNPNQINYLFFRMLSLIDLCLNVLGNIEEIEEEVVW